MLALLPDATTGLINLQYSGGRLVSSGYDLETAVIISLFTDAERAGPADNAEARAGWWADSFAPEIEGSEATELGSQLWTLDTASATEAPGLAERYALDALQWLIDDGHARSVTAAASVAAETLYLALKITLATGDEVSLGPFDVGGRQ